LPTVLIVDDHPMVRSAIRSALSSYGDFTVCGEAIDGVDAVDKAVQLKPDLILLDVAMPRMNGLQAATVLKSLMPQVRIIALTLYSAELSEDLASTAGIDAVFAKAEGIGKVVECFQTLLSEPARAPSRSRRQV
jgi:DNA-binding NarL/FixJ family response regulator